MRLFAVSLLAGSCMGAATPVNRRKLSYTSILGYSPGTQVDDHARERPTHKRRCQQTLS
jgi:hypothetical protein